MARKDPVRTAATKKRIADAFWSLYCVDDSGTITASAVARVAGVNRSTFYAHFRDVGDVLECIESDLMDYMRNKAVEIATTVDPVEAAKIARGIFDERGDQLRVFLGKHRSERVLESARSMLGRIVSREMLGVEGEPVGAARYKAEFVAAGLIGAYTRWLEDDRPVPIEEVASALKTSALAVAWADRFFVDQLQSEGSTGIPLEPPVRSIQYSAIAPHEP